MKHFFENVSKDTAEEDTSVEVTLGNEILITFGMQILEKNFLETDDFDKGTYEINPKFSRR